MKNIKMLNLHRKKYKEKEKSDLSPKTPIRKIERTYKMLKDLLHSLQRLKNTFYEDLSWTCSDADLISI